MAKLISLFTVCILLFTSCCMNSEYYIPSTRTYSAYNNLSETDKSDLICAFDKLSSEVIQKEVFKICDQYLTDNALDYLKTQKVFLYKDNLLLSSNGNHKVRCNGILIIDFLLQSKESNFTKESAQKFTETYFDFLYDDLLISSQIMSIEIFVWENEENVLASYGGSEIDIAFPAYLEQDETEYKAQTIAYNFNQSNTNFSLKKFGHINTNQLYIEYIVSDEYFDSHSESSLKDIAIDVTTLLLSNEDTIFFIEQNNTQKIIVAFTNTNILSGNNVEFSIEL